MTDKQKEKGFTLIEIAIVMVIAGLFMVMLIKVYEQYVIEKRDAKLVKTVDQVTSALAYYIQDDGIAYDQNGNPAPDIIATTGIDESRDPTRYPCPAGPNLSVDDTNFGVELRNTNTGKCSATNGVTVTGAGASRVYIGSVPAVTLGLSPSKMFDQYGNRFTYAVSRRVSDSNPVAGREGGALGGGANPPGSIIVEQYDEDGVALTDLNNVPFVIVSHGENGAGARTMSGGTRFPCSNGGRDSENCDGDDRFTDAMLYKTTNDTHADEYDDTIIVSLKGLNDKEEYWGLGPNSTDMVSLNTGNIGIGRNNPSQKIDVEGRVRAHSYLHASDRKLKENIENLDTALNKIEDINIVTYDYKDRASKHKNIGVIAQDINKIYPEFVHEGTDGNLSVDYVSLTAPIIKALQELSQRQKDEIKALKKQINDLSRNNQPIEKPKEKTKNYHNTGKVYYND